MTAVLDFRCVGEPDVIRHVDLDDVPRRGEFVGYGELLEGNVESVAWEFGSGSSRVRIIVRRWKDEP